MPEWAPEFLAALRAKPSVYLAAHAAGVRRSLAYREKDRGGPFAEEWDEIIRGRLDVVESCYLERATGWVERTVQVDPEGLETVTSRDRWDPRHARHVLEQRVPGWEPQRDDAPAVQAPAPIVITDASGAAMLQELERLRARVAELEGGEQP